MPDVGALTDVLQAPSFWQVASAAALGGLVRGFAGFGAALIFMPIAGAIYTPAMAAVLLLIVDTCLTTPLFVRSLKNCAWREILPLLAGTALSAPLGVLFLVRVDPTIARGVISLFILIFVLVLASGWRYRRSPSAPLSFGVGAATGLIGGMTNLYGPPVVLFWLSGQASSMIVRANIFVFFGLTPIISLLLFWWHEIFTLERLLLASVLMPIYGGALWLGARWVRGADERTYRFVALGLAAVIAVFTAPIW